MDRLDHPDMPVQLVSLQEALQWASGCRIVWQDTNEGGVVRNAGQVWGELRLRTVEPLGVDERSYQETANTDWPLQECIVGLRLWNVQLTMRSRKQNFEDANVAWYAALKAQMRLRYEFVRKQWFNPVKIALVTPGTVINMGNSYEFDDRAEDFAVLDMVFSALMSDTDAAAVTSWIEHIEMSTGLLKSEESPLDDSLQLDDEVIP